MNFKDSSDNDQAVLSFCAKDVGRWLLITALFLSALSLTFHLIEIWIPIFPIRALTWLFSVDTERNLPSFFSALMLLLCSLLMSLSALACIATRRRLAPYWGGLALIFLGLSWDEAVSLHEWLIGSSIITDLLGLEQEGVFTFSWVVPGMAALALFLVAYTRFFMALPKSVKAWMITAFSIYFFGVLGMELIGGIIIGDFSELVGPGEVVDPSNIRQLLYLFSVTIEETFEMIGLACLVHALTKYLSLCLKEVRFSFSEKATLL